MIKKDKLFAVGDWSTFSNVAELYLVKESRWQPVDAYPFGDFIFFAPVVGVNDDFYVFGGYVDYAESPTIAQFSTRTQTWSHIGGLLTRRDGHSVTVLDDQFLIIGGYSDGSVPTEKCLLIGRVSYTYS